MQERSRALLARLQNTGPQATQALETIHALHAESMVRAAWLFTGDWNLAQDAVQECLIALPRAAKRARVEEGLKPWLYGVLLNTCRAMLRARRRAKKREEGRANSEQRSQPAPSSALHVNEQAQALRRALVTLPEAQRIVVVLRYWEQMSVAECATLLRIPEGSVKSRCHSALKSLRGLLSEWQHDEL